MEFQNQDIKCNIFWNAQAVIKKAEAKMKEVKAIKERQYYVQDILVEIGSLLLCANYNAGDTDCISCHSILRRYIKEYKYLAKVERKEAL